MSFNSLDSIVNIEVSVTLAPVSAKLQQQVCVVSAGATNITVGSTTVLTGTSGLTSIIAAPITITSATWASGTVTLNLASPVNLTVGGTADFTISGMVPTGYNGTYTCTVTAPTTITYPLGTNPGTATTFGTIIPNSVSDVTGQVTSFFTRGTNVALNLLELGLGTASTLLPNLTTFINANQYQYYIYLLPSSWSAVNATPAMCQTYTGTTAMVYFFIRATPTNYSTVGSMYLGIKSAFVYTDGVTDTANNVHGAATISQIVASNNPTQATPLTPLLYSFLPGCTSGAWNTTARQYFITNSMNYADDGGEGGLPNQTILKGATVSSGVPFNFWYITDWLAINLQQNIANAVINGANNTVAPLVYNQNGINDLQSSAQVALNRASQSLMLAIPATVNAIPLATYIQTNPSDYGNGIYSGLSASCVAMADFKKINFNLNVSQTLPVTANTVVQ